MTATTRQDTALAPLAWLQSVLESWIGLGPQKPTLFHHLFPAFKKPRPPTKS